MKSKKDVFAYNSVVFIKKLSRAKENREGMLCAMLAYSAFEAIFHDLTTFYYAAIKYKKNKLEEEREQMKLPRFLQHKNMEIHYYNGITEEEVKFCQGFRQIECGDKKDNDFLKRIKIGRKLIKKCESFIYIFSGESIDNNPIFQKLEQLIDIRHQIIHTKGISYQLSDGEDVSSPMTIDHMPECLKKLVSDDIIKLPQTLKSWLVIIDTKEFCEWCGNILIDVVNELIRIIPQPSMSEVYFLKFRELLTC